jgi:hypothetical protein
LRQRIKITNYHEAGPEQDAAAAEPEVEPELIGELEPEGDDEAM